MRKIRITGPYVPEPKPAAEKKLKPGSDFVQVQLTRFGVQHARGGAVRVIEGHLHEVFEPGKPRRVSRRYDWEMVLRNWRIGGQPLFELVGQENK